MKFLNKNVVLITDVSHLTSKLWCCKMGVFHAFATCFDVLMNGIRGHCKDYINSELNY